MRGSVFKRCPCPPERNAKGERLACKKKHGSWSYVVDLGRGDGKRKQEKRGGFRTKDDAEVAMAAIIDAIGKGTHAHDDGMTVRTFLLGDPARRVVGWVDAKVAAGNCARPPSGPTASTSATTSFPSSATCGSGTCDPTT